MAIGSTYIDLKWDAAIDNVAVTGYRVYYGNGTLISDVGNSLFFRVSGLVKDTQYTFKIIAYDGSGNDSVFSNTVTAQTLLYDGVYDSIISYANSKGWTVPSTAVQAEQQALIETLTDYGLWEGYDLFYMFAQDGSDEFARINWANPGAYDLVPIGTGTGSSSINGWAFSGSDGFETNWAPDVNNVMTTRSDSEIGFYLTSTVNEDNHTIFGGGMGSDAPNMTTADNTKFSTYRSAHVYFKGYKTSWDIYDASDWFYTGYYCSMSLSIERQADGSLNSAIYYRNGTRYNTYDRDASSQADITIGMGVGVFLRETATPTSYMVNGQVLGMVSCGRASYAATGSDASDVNVNNAINAYFTAIGATMDSAAIDAYLIEQNNLGVSNQIIEITDTPYQRTSASDSAVAELVSRNNTIITP